MNTLIEFIINLFRSPASAAEFVADPEEAMRTAGLPRSTRPSCRRSRRPRLPPAPCWAAATRSSDCSAPSPTITTSPPRSRPRPPGPRRLRVSSPAATTPSSPAATTPTWPATTTRRC
ncbi:IniB N-terminal domain-containing protein [Mycolicibacterium sp. D3]